MIINTSYKAEPEEQISFLCMMQIIFETFMEYESSTGMLDKNYGKRDQE